MTQDAIFASTCVMSPTARIKRDFDELERRRIRAAKLLNRGVRQAEVARQVKVSRESVRRWSNQIAKQGAAGLKKAARAGRPPGLSAAQLKKLETLLREGAPKAGFPNGLWTLDRIAQLIRQHFQGKVSLRSRVVDSTPEIGLELPASGGPCTRAERGGYPRLEGKYLARS